MKSAKRILLGNIDPRTGNLDTDAAAKAIMLHRNTPTQDTGIAPSVMLFGRPLRDHLPQMKRELRPEWKAINDAREMALAKRVFKPIPSTDDRKELRPLEIGDSVQIQNQAGSHPNKWSNTGVVSEVLPYRQYNVVVDGSRRVTLRNRKFLKKIDPIARKDIRLPEIDLLEPLDVQSSPMVPLEANEPPVHQVQDAPRTEVPCPTPQVVPEAQPLRRSTRTRKQPTRFVARVDGKTHGEE